MNLREDPVVTAGLFVQLSKDLAQLDGDEIATRVEQFAWDFIDCTHVNLLRAAGRTGLAMGPAAEALAIQDVVVVPDTLSEDRWPSWATTTANAGLRSALAVPLATNSSMFGVLELFSNKPYRFEAADAAAAQALAGHAAVAMQAAHEEATLRQAVGARQLTGQATGVLMERYGLDADRAFAVLRRLSQDSNVKLRDVSRQLLESGQLPTAIKEPRGAARNQAPVSKHPSSTDVRRPSSGHRSPTSTFSPRTSNPSAASPN